MLEHNTEFDGEDLQMGLILRRMGKGKRGKELGQRGMGKEEERTLSSISGYTIGVNAVEPVPTTSPRSLLWEPIPYPFEFKKITFNLIIFLSFVICYFCFVMFIFFLIRCY